MELENMGEKVLEEGLMSDLIVAITNPTAVDADFLQDFLITYRLFTSPDLFLQALIDRYNSVSDDDWIIRLRVCNCLRVWSEKYWYDSERENTKVIERVTDFVKSINIEEESKLVSEFIEKIRSKPKKSEPIDGLPPIPIIPKEKDFFLNLKLMK